MCPPCLSSIWGWDGREILIEVSGAESLLEWLYIDVGHMLCFCSRLPVLLSPLSSMWLTLSWMLKYLKSYKTCSYPQGTEGQLGLVSITIIITIITNLLSISNGQGIVLST